jgi:lipid A 4'-phosphatase
MMPKEGKNSYTMGMWLLLFLIFAPLSPQIDLYVSGLFYSPEVGFHDNLFLRLLFEGEHFGLFTGAVASIVFALSFFWVRLKKWRGASLAVVLTLVIGAGVITNWGFKGHWGRPRPRQVVEFGGKHVYRPFWHPDIYNAHDPQKSFPSGHVAMGFYFLSFCLAGKRMQSRALFYLGLFLTLFLGIGLMIARVMQGAHFVSDVLASFLIMWYVAKAMDLLHGWYRRNRLLA